jgi:hypothetical protein
MYRPRLIRQIRELFRSDHAVRRVAGHGSGPERSVLMHGRRPVDQLMPVGERFRRWHFMEFPRQAEVNEPSRGRGACRWRPLPSAPP